MPDNKSNRESSNVSLLRYWIAYIAGIPERANINAWESLVIYFPLTRWHIPFSIILFPRPRFFRKVDVVCWPNSNRLRQKLRYCVNSGTTVLYTEYRLDSYWIAMSRKFAEYMEHLHRLYYTVSSCIVLELMIVPSPKKGLTTNRNKLLLWNCSLIN